MTDNFIFSIADEEKKYLKGLVKLSIVSKLKTGGSSQDIPEPPTLRLKENLGAFVTLSLEGHLRGCIGNVQGTGPLYETIWKMARAAAFEDPRFSPLTLSEIEEIAFEISILGPLSPCTDTDKIVIGRHGLIMQQGTHSGLLLPQVPVEWKWDRLEFLAQTCRKAGLAPDAWKNSRTNILWFEAEVF